MMRVSIGLGLLLATLWSLAEAQPRPQQASAPLAPEPSGASQLVITGSQAATVAPRSEGVSRVRATHERDAVLQWLSPYPPGTVF